MLLNLSFDMSFEKYGSDVSHEKHSVSIKSGCVTEALFRFRSAVLDVVSKNNNHRSRFRVSPHTTSSDSLRTSLVKALPLSPKWYTNVMNVQNARGCHRPTQS